VLLARCEPVESFTPKSAAIFAIGYATIRGIMMVRQYAAPSSCALRSMAQLFQFILDLILWKGRAKRIRENTDKIYRQRRIDETKLTTAAQVRAPHDEGNENDEKRCN
jgi:hypothetical protein